jgi:hypothetical protein
MGSKTRSLRADSEFWDRVEEVARTLDLSGNAMMLGWLRVRLEALAKFCDEHGGHVRGGADRCARCGESKAESRRRTARSIATRPVDEPVPVPEAVADRTFEQRPPVEEEDVSQVVPMRF